MNILTPFFSKLIFWAYPLLPPRSSVVGPILFLIYTFDIFQVTASSHVQCYADDTQLLFCFDPAEADEAKDLINQDLNAIYEYSQEHNLKINPKKTEVLLFCAEKRRQMLQAQLKLILGDSDLGFSSCAKNLGIYIDTNLRFKEHIKKLLQKSYLKMKVLYANRFILNFKIRKKLCESLVLSLYHYCNIVFYPCLDLATKNRLQIVQNTCCRYIYNLRKFDHISDKRKELRWLNICNTVKLHFAMFLTRLLDTNLPTYLREKLIFRTAIHDRPLRDRGLLTMPQHHSAMFQRSFTYNAVSLYNSLDPDLKNCTVLVLKSKYKTILLELQNA